MASMATESEASTRKRKHDNTIKCPYLDTIQRSLLDFDVLPACAVSLQSGPHIYACLSCGKYLRGKSPHSPAYTHAVEDSHFCFVHLTAGTFHCLPDDYEICHPEDLASLQDIRAALHPTFSDAQIASLDKQTELSRDLFGRRYLPGYSGLNNLNRTDGLNAVVQALSHVKPLRDFFLAGTRRALKKTPKDRKATQVAEAFGQVVRKLWSRQRFKSHVDPHVLVQAVAAGQLWEVGTQVEMGEFMRWFLHQLHTGTGGSRKPGSSIVHKCFQGKVQVTTRQPKKHKRVVAAPVDDREGSDVEDDIKEEAMEDVDEAAVEETTVDTHFLQLTLDLPVKPLFNDEDGGLVIPQEPLVSVLKKFDGVSFSDALGRSGEAQRKRYRLLDLPDYLILHLARFKTNKYRREKNPTIVAFPVKNLDLTEYVHDGKEKETPPTEKEIQAMSIKELKDLLIKYGRSDLAKQAVEKKDLVETVVNFVVQSLPDLLRYKYDLVANITHDSAVDVGREGKVDVLQEGSYKCHVQHSASKQWYELQDGHVQDIMPQQIGVSESYLLIFERKKG